MTDDLLFRTDYYQRVLRTRGNALVAYWPMWEPSGTVAINLQMTPARNGVYTGVELNNPGMGDGRSAPYFDGTNDFCNVYSTALNSAFNNAEGTIALWAKVNAAAFWTDGLAHRLMILRADTNNRLFIFKPTTSNTLQWFYIAGATTKSVSLTISSTDWMHLALTWSKSADQMIAYVNGAQTGATQTALGTWAGALASTVCCVGAASTAPAEVHNGNCAHAALWSAPLSALEIAEIARVR